MDIEEVKRRVLPVLRKYGVRRASIFGSVVKGGLREDSDIDILVEIDKDISLLDFIALKLELEDVLGRKVDLVEFDAIKPELKEKILKEQVAII